MKRMPGPRLRAAVLLVLIGALGFTTGILTDRLLLARAVQTSEATETPTAIRGGAQVIRGGETGTIPPAGGLRVLYPFAPPEWMTEALRLTPEQQLQVERILSESQGAFRATVARFEPELAAVIEETRSKILEVLTDEQVAEWESLSDQRSRQLFRR